MAQPDASSESSDATDMLTLADEFLADAEKIKDELLQNPELLQGLLKNLTSSGPLQSFLSDVQFNFKLFDSQTADSLPTSLGFEYSFDRSVQNWTREGAVHPLGLSFNFTGTGNVAFDKSVNPTDYMKTAAELHVFQFISRANRINIIEAQADALQQLILEAATIEGTPEELEASPEWQRFKNKFFEDYVSKLGTTLLWDFTGHASLESNQDFSAKQYSYGLQLGLVPRAWSSDNALSLFNLFDYPFAFMRVLTGLDESFQPSGRAVPTFVFGVDLVNPTGDLVRQNITRNGDSFGRLRGEITMRTKLGKGATDDEALWFSATWNYYREIGASTATVVAGLREQSHVVASLEFPQGWMVTYREGKLPLDRSADSVWGLGFNFTF